MTPQQLKAMKLALEALKVVTKEMMAIRDELAEYGEGRPITNGIHQLLWDSSFKAYTETAIPAYAALEEALAEHAMRETQRLGQEIEQEPVPCCGKYETCTQACTPRGRFLGKREALAQPEQEPVAWCSQFEHSCVQPPRRKPLTDEQIESLLMNWPEDGIAFFEFARAIEAAHGIKENT